jgi:hypothetical protein
MNSMYQKVGTEVGGGSEQGVGNARGGELGWLSEWEKKVRVRVVDKHSAAL